MFCYSLQFFFTCTSLLFLLLFCGPSMSVLAHPSAYGHFLYFSGLILLSVLSLYLLHLGFKEVLGLIFHALSSALGGFVSCRKRGHESTRGPREPKREIVTFAEHRSQQQSQFCIDWFVFQKRQISQNFSFSVLSQIPGVPSLWDSGISFLPILPC